MFLNDIVFIDGSLNRHLLTCQRLFKRRRIIYLVLRSIPWRYTVKYFVHLFWYWKLCLQLERNKFLVNKQFQQELLSKWLKKTGRKLEFSHTKQFPGHYFVSNFFYWIRKNFWSQKTYVQFLHAKKMISIS